MKLNSCDKYRDSFSTYLDGAVSGRQMQSIARHLESCDECRAEFETMRQIQQSLSILGPAKAPENMGRRLRVAISHEIAARQSNWRESLALRWDNAIRPLAVQISAGFATSVALVGSIVMLLGTIAVPSAVMANDEPLMGSMTTPHYLYSADMPRPIVTRQDTVIVVEAMINDLGRVYDYHIVSGPEDETVRRQVIDQLTLSVFQPATVFGTPVRGRVVMTFSGISVQG